MSAFASYWPVYVVLALFVTGALAWLAAAFALVVVLVRGIVRLGARRRQAPEPVAEPSDDWSSFVYEACHTTSCAHLSTPHQVAADGSLICLRCEHVVPAA